MWILRDVKSFCAHHYFIAPLLTFFSFQPFPSVILFQSVLFSPNLFHSNLLYSILFYSILAYAILPCSLQRNHTVLTQCLGQPLFLYPTHPTSSHFVSSVLYILLPSYPVPSYPVPSRPIPSHPIPFHTIIS